MVRYRPEAGERGYTFRLNNGGGGNGNNGDVNGISPTGTLLSEHSNTSTLESSVYKERIDSLFRYNMMQQHRRNNKAAQNPPEMEEEETEEPTMEHLQQHFQKVLAEQQRSKPQSSKVNQQTSSSMGSSKNLSTTYIQVNNQVNISSSNGKADISSTTPSNGSLNNQTRAQRFNEARNAVQAQIEKMFQDASNNANGSNNKAQESAGPVTIINVRGAPSEPPAPVSNSSILKVSHSKQNVPLPPIPTSSAPPVSVTTTPPAPPNPTPSTGSTNQYKVDYLGSLSLPGRATSLESLQYPLKELYSLYRMKNLNSKSVYRGTMEISPAGLRILYSTSEGRRSVPQEILNPFPTIAVWAAVKFVARGEESESGGRKFAFLPLICDPENQDKQNLFHPLRPEEDGEWVRSPAFHPPLFTCVMRSTAAPKSLECHAFVCDNPEDAIVIAANLYQALLRNMKTNEPQVTSSNSTTSAVPSPAGATSRPSAQQQNIYSPASSVSNWSESSIASGAVHHNGQPVRPPRRKKSSKLITDGGLERRKSVRRSQNKNRSSQGKANLRRSMRHSSQRSNASGRIKRSVSERQLGEMLSDHMMDSHQSSGMDKHHKGVHQQNGDILTKVALPRSKSFMTVPQQNYSISELFEEIKKQEGIKSVDDVLKTIVNKDRMSFNDLSPAYKEMLMKLALTLTKDEMFQRSKNIMRHQTKVKGRPKSTSLGRLSSSQADTTITSNSDAEHSTSSSRISSVLRATKKSFSKWGSRSASTGYSVSGKEDKHAEPLLLKNTRLLNGVEPIKVTLPTPAVKHQPFPVPIMHKTPLPPRAVSATNLHLSSSGNNKKPADVLSCSECGYDSESCYQHKCYCSSFNDTQSQATDYSDGERCYCSLKRISKSSGAPVYRIRLDSDDTSDTSHDTLPEPPSSKYHSNNKSNTGIHAHNKSSNNRHHNYARKSASMTSWSALSGAESPLTAWRRNTANLNHHSTPSGTTKVAITHQQSSSSSSFFSPSSASSLRQKSLSSYLSDTSLDSDVVAMTEPAHHHNGNSSNSHKSFAKQPEILRRKSRSSYLTSSETEMDSLTTTSCNSFIRGSVPSVQQQQQQRNNKASPAESVGYQSYDSTGTGSSSGRASRILSLDDLSSDGRRNSNSSSERSQKSQNSGGRGNKFLMVSAVDPKGKIVYRGTSSAGATHRAQSKHRAALSNGGGKGGSGLVPEGALAAKKTTEIAAMFSNLKLNQTTDIVIDDSEATTTDQDTASELSTDDAYSSMHYRGKHHRNNKNGFSKSLENSLGYLP